MLKHQRVTVQVGMLFDDGKDPVAPDSDVTYLTKKPYSTLEQIRDLVVNEVDDGNFVVVDSIIEDPKKVEDNAVPCDRCGMWAPNHQFACPQGPPQGTRFGPLEAKMLTGAEIKVGDIVSRDDGTRMVLVMRCYVNENIDAMAADVDDNSRDEHGDCRGPFRMNFDLKEKFLVLRARGIHS